MVENSGSTFEKYQLLVTLLLSLSLSTSLSARDKFVR